MAKYGKSIGTLPGQAIEKTIEDQKKGKFGKKLTFEEASIEIKQPEGFIEGTRARRKMPSRLESFMERFAPKGGPSYKELEMALPAIGPAFHPRPTRVVGQLADIPINIAQALPGGIEKFMSYEPGKPLPEEAKQIGPKLLERVLSGMLTTFLHPIESLYEDPIEAIGDVYTGTQLVKGVVGATGAAKKGIGTAWRKTFPKRTYKSIGEDLSRGIREVDKFAGKAVGAEKAALKGIKEPVDVRPALQKLQAERANFFDSSGKLQTSQANLKAIDDIIDDLKGGFVSADDLVKVKSKIYDDYINFGKPGQIVPKVSGNTERILLQSTDDINSGIGSLADKYGASQWKATNAQFSRIRDLRLRLARKLGTDQTNLSTRMKTIGKKIVEGDESYLDLFNDIQKEIGYLKPEYAGAMRDLEKMTLTERGLSKIGTGSVLGTTPRLLGGVKDVAKAKLMGGADIAKSAYLGPRIFGKQLPGIQQVPYSPGLAGLTLLSKSGYARQ